MTETPTPPKGNRRGRTKDERAKHTRELFGKLTKRKTANGQTRWYAEYHHHKERHTPGVGFTTKQDAQDWLARERARISEGRWTAPRQRREDEQRAKELDATRSLTVTELLEDWLTRADNLKETTRRSHALRLKLRVLGEVDPLGRNTLEAKGVQPLGNERVVDVDKARIKRWVSETEKIWPYGKKGYSTTYYAQKRLATAFNWAITELELIEDNPVTAVPMRRPPNYTKSETVLSDTEVKTLTDNFPEWLRHAPQIMAGGGLRVGELLEVRVKDLKRINNPGTPLVITIARNVQDTTRVDGGKETIINTTPKTEAGARDVVLPTAASDAVRKHLRDFNKVNPEDLVVSRRNGNQFTVGHFRDHHFKPAARTAGRPDATPHSMRRYYGTRLVGLVMRGIISLEDATRQMGHETKEMLLEYLRSSADYQDRIAAAFDELD